MTHIRSQCLSKGTRSIACTIVRHDRGDGDPDAGEEGVGAGRSGLLALIVQDLGVHHPGTGADRVVEIGIATWTTGLLVPVPLGSSHDTMPTTIRDSAQFLDIDMDQLTGSGHLVAHRLRCTNRLSRHAIHVRQEGHLVTVKHPTNS